MTKPAYKPTARDQVYDAHLAAGWAMFGTCDTHWLLRRDDVSVHVAFTPRGALVSGNRETRTGHGTTTDTAGGTLGTVLAWLATSPTAA